MYDILILSSADSKGGFDSLLKNYVIIEIPSF